MDFRCYIYKHTTRPFLPFNTWRTVIIGDKQFGLQASSDKTCMAYIFTICYMHTFYHAIALIAYTCLSTIQLYKLRILLPDILNII